MAVLGARPRGRIPLEELCRLPNFYLPLLSWSRDKVAFYWDKTGRMELYVMDLATRAVRQVSHGEVPRALRTGFVWDRTDRSIVFGRDVAGDEQHDLFKIDVETSEVTPLSSGGVAEQHAVEFSPDNEWLIVNTNKRLPETPDRPGQMNLWRMRADGTAYEPVTRFRFPAFGGQWSPDGAWLAFVSNEDERDLKNRSGYLVRPDGSDVRRVFHVRDGSQDFFGRWHPDGRRIAVTSDASGRHRAGVLEVATGELRWLTPDGADHEEFAVRFADDGSYLVCFRDRESQYRPVLYDLATGAPREFQLPAGIATLARPFDRDRKLLVAYATDRARPTLIAYDLATDTQETLLAPEYGAVDPTVFVEAEHVWYESFDGLRIPAILYAPRALPQGENLPAVVAVHGGPTAQWLRGFDPFAQFLVDRGYVVLEPNIRGSTGYGVAFRDAALRDWGGKDLEDVVFGARYLSSLPYVDASRIAVFGGSYGGFMTFIAATKRPDVWKAAVPAVGVTDLHRMWDESKEHFRYFLREQMGDPETDRALWRDRSAIEFAHQLKAKTLIVHGVHDPRCPVSQSRIFRDRLLELGYKEGRDFEYVEYDDIGHGSVDIDHRIRQYALLADFLDRVV